MSLSALSRAPGFALNSQPPELMSSPSARRSLLVIGCVASMAFAAWLGEPLASTQADPELAHLLRGMAAIKATMVVAALGVLFWRFGQPVQQHTAAAYLAGAWLIAGVTILVWQLSFILFAALAFHVGVFSLLFVAWRDHQAGS